jgi:hypothetical protein
MAVGTVSGSNLDEQWQLITSTAATGSSLTFSSLSGYKHIWITGVAITKSSADYVVMRPNNDTSAGSYATSWQSGGSTQFLSSSSSATSQATSFKIYNIDQSAPHKIEGASDYTIVTPQDAYINPVPITSILVKNFSNATFTGGTFYVYGIAA